MATETQKSFESWQATKARLGLTDKEVHIITVWKTPSGMGPERVLVPPPGVDTAEFFPPVKSRA